ncbi:MAG: putative regulatory protein, FmdB [Dehalococcoidia bacterium]|nr:putative regulatory protein, FmdB [Dehalococcoidia bacterium]
MPIYEYRCQSCHRKVSVFFRSYSDTKEPRCSHCGSAELTRLVSSFTVTKSWGESLDRMPSFESTSDFDEDDPRSVARMVRRLRQETGGGLGPEEEEMLERMEAGELPEDPGDSDADGGWGA